MTSDTELLSQLEAQRDQLAELLTESGGKYLKAATLLDKRRARVKRAVRTGKNVFTAPELAEMTGISVRTIRDWIYNS